MERWFIIVVVSVLIFDVLVSVRVGLRLVKVEDNQTIYSKDLQDIRKQVNQQNSIIDRLDTKTASGGAYSSLDSPYNSFTPTLPVKRGVAK